MPAKRRSESYYLSEKFKCFCIARVRARHALEHVEKRLSEYGPTSVARFHSFVEARRFLMPLRSFPVRTVLLGYGSWTVLITNDRNDNSNTDAFLLSQSAGCDALSVSMQLYRREFAVHEGGVTLREIQSLWDGDRWYFRQSGRPLSFEDRSECFRSKATERLGVSAVLRYFQSYTKVAIPEWTEGTFDQMFGIERSTAEFKVPIIDFDTKDDL